MTFWGAEVKPGKPLTFNAEDLDGKLVLTQATLGIGSSTKKSILQVNVGDKSPVFLCTLLPDKIESCSLTLEFDEEDDVKFSVIGPTSIHLSGFVQSNLENEYDSDSYGEDIAESDSESSDYDSEDVSEDEFLDGDDDTMFPPSPVRKSGVVIEEIVDEEKTATENGGTKKGKKKKQLADTDNDKKAEQQIVLKENNGASVLESEDEDGFPVSSSRKSENLEANTTTKVVEEKKKNKKDEAKDNVESEKNLKRKVDAIKSGQEQKSDAIENGEASENMKKKQKKKKKGKTEKSEEVSKIEQDANAEPKQISKTDKVVKQSKEKPARVKTFPNGLVIEDVAMGKPDGKRASRGSKVSVYYIGKLQKNGKRFDSNTSGKPFKFRLGIGQVIKGWDVGVEGMRVGDKRRLTIPPSMGYGASGAPPQIPPNAWLVFDVELVDVA
ncbi:peptidyl-prolyl cis-trans isomerase FKBP53-like [Chenopodium quinoa]|uniref:peptidyl-prolyl cis-trans isomerase FKBP53-like n=1 Tax=Chenopodium quinoa TaxID=63459 RepID=UPI000B7870BC|nr:peptidyl-prolyl cis-trans isomerase FKBP53-like [Chenopodium quinoa]